MIVEQTYWQGQPVQARRVNILVHNSGKFLRAWYAGLVDTVRPAVEIMYNNRIFYIDDFNGEGWEKVTTQRGNPSFPFKEIEGRLLEERT